MPNIYNDKQNLLSIPLVILEDKRCMYEIVQNASVKYDIHIKKIL